MSFLLSPCTLLVQGYEPESNRFGLMPVLFPPNKISSSFLVPFLPCIYTLLCLVPRSESNQFVLSVFSEQQKFMIPVHTLRYLSDIHTYTYTLYIHTYVHTHSHTHTYTHTHTNTHTHTLSFNFACVLLCFNSDKEMINIHITNIKCQHGVPEVRSLFCGFENKIWFCEIKTCMPEPLRWRRRKGWPQELCFLPCFRVVGALQMSWTRFLGELCIYSRTEPMRNMHTA
jgi:hypothetical protein